MVGGRCHRPFQRAAWTFRDKPFHLSVQSSLRATDTGINREHEHGHVGQVATLQQMQHGGEIGERRRANAEALEVFGAVAFR